MHLNILAPYPVMWKNEEKGLDGQVVHYQSHAIVKMSPSKLTELVSWVPPREFWPEVIGYVITHSSGIVVPVTEIEIAFLTENQSLFPQFCQTPEKACSHCPQSRLRP